MYAMDFIEVFVTIYNFLAAVTIIFFCVYILLKTHQMNRNLLKARIFLNSFIMEQTWVYLSIAGASFALNTLLKLAVRLEGMGNISYIPYMVGLTQIIFLIAFILAVDCCCLLIGGGTRNGGADRA